MLLRIVLLLVVIVLILYLLLPEKRVAQLGARLGQQSNRLLMVLLSISASVFFILAALCALVWFGSLDGGITGGGDVLSRDTLLRLAGLFLVLALVCVVLVLYGRKP